LVVFITGHQLADNHFQLAANSALPEFERMTIGIADEDLQQIICSRRPKPRDVRLSEREVR
jgi:hypothetical protein